MTEQDDRPDVWKMMLGSGGMYEEECLEQGLIRIGFGIHEDLSNKDHAKIKQIVDAQSGLTDGQKVVRAMLLDTFCNRMEVNDLVAVVLKKQPGYLAIGRVDGDYTYQVDSASMPHARSVEWLTSGTPLSPYWEDVLPFLLSVATILPIRNVETRDRLRQFADSGAVSSQDSTGTDPASEEPAEDPIVLGEIARTQIASLISGRFPDKRMEHLVAGVLQAAGYTIAPLVDGADQGVDVIAGGGLLGFEDPLLCAQVKHTDKPANAPSVQQLRGAVEQFGAKQGLFVSWSGYTSDALKEARQSFFRVRLWDANDLIDAICKHYSNLPDDIRKDIPLQQIWTVVPKPIDE